MEILVYFLQPLWKKFLSVDNNLQKQILFNFSLKIEFVQYKISKNSLRGSDRNVNESV